MSPLISCIVPVFNGERYLAEALESVLTQTHRPIELIVVDDGSTDRTAEILAAFGARIRSLWQPNTGPAAARNLGLREARGGFIAFQDADDIWHPEKLTRQMERFRARPELDISVTGVQNFWEPALRDDDPRYQDLRNRVPWPGYCCPTMLARRGVFEVVGSFNNAMRSASDDEWFIRAAEQKVIVELLPAVLLRRRLHSSNLTLQTSAHGFATRLRLLKASLDRRRRILVP
jgi:glycosyltransferase involved in cell wall biosynthesis